MKPLRGAFEIFNCEKFKIWEKNEKEICPQRHKLKHKESALKINYVNLVVAK